MNEELVTKLENPAYELGEAEELMHLAAQEIRRLNDRIIYLTECIHKLRDENDRLALDLGIRNDPQLGNRY